MEDLLPNDVPPSPPLKRRRIGDSGSSTEATLTAVSPPASQQSPKSYEDSDTPRLDKEGAAEVIRADPCGDDGSSEEDASSDEEDYSSGDDGSKLLVGEEEEDDEESEEAEDGERETMRRNELKPPPDGPMRSLARRTYRDTPSYGPLDLKGPEHIVSPPSRPHRPMPSRTTAVEGYNSQVYRFFWDKPGGGKHSRYVSRQDDKDERPVTAYLMNGKGTGMVSISDVDYSAFLRAYAHDIGMSVRHYISEQRSAVHRGHIDLDFYLDNCAGIKKMPTEELVKLARIFIYEIRRFYPPEKEGAATESERVWAPPPKSFKDLKPEAMPASSLNDRCFSAYILDSPPKDVVKKTETGQEIPCVKIGVHIIFPYLHTDSHKQLWQREAYLRAIEKLHGPRQTAVGNNWQDVIDQGIYITSGLRLPYSYKSDPCPSCRNASAARAACNTCMSVGRIDEARAYVPRLLLDGRGRIDRSARAEQLVGPRADLYTVVSTASIRLSSRYHPHPGWYPPPDVPQYDLTEGTARKTGGTKRKRTDAPGRAPSGAGFVEVPKDSPLFSRMMYHIHRMHPNYAKLEGMKLVRNPKGTFYSMTVRGPGDGWCFNLNNREHAACKIRFELLTEGLRQCCFCKHDHKEDRLYGACNKFKSQMQPIDSETRCMFFETHDETMLDVCGEARVMSTMAALKRSTGGKIVTRASAAPSASIDRPFGAHVRVLARSQSEPVLDMRTDARQGCPQGGASEAARKRKEIDTSKLFPVPLAKLYMPETHADALSSQIRPAQKDAATLPRFPSFAGRAAGAVKIEPGVLKQEDKGKEKV